MVLSPGPVSIVGCFVIVPGTEPRRRRMGRLEVRIRFVLCVTEPVIRQGQTLARGFVIASELPPHLAAIAVATVFVEVIARVKDRMSIAPTGDLPIGVEIAEGEIRARDHGDTEIRHPGGGKRSCRSSGRHRLAGPEPIKEGLAGGQADNIHLDGVIPLGSGYEYARLNNIGEGPISRHRPVDGNGPRCLRRYPSPEYDARLGGISRRHPVLKRRLALVDRSPGWRGCARRGQAGGACAKDPAPGE